MSDNKKGCWLCKHLDYYEAYYEESNSSGFCCNYREEDVHDTFKTFPCNRKLKCFEPRNPVGKTSLPLNKDKE